jgi:hypothetical protein
LNVRQLVAVDADAYIVCAEVSERTFKIFRLTCARDGSIYVNFPYIPDGGALIGEVSLSPDTVYPCDLTVGPDFATTVHKVKYAHHPDGEAHFSQTGKILTKIRRKAVSFEDARGHLFTVMAEGVMGFNELATRKSSRKARVIPFGFNPPVNSIKIVAHLHTKPEWASFARYGDPSKPWISVAGRDGNRGVGIVLTTKARRGGNALYMLLTAQARETQFAENDVQLAFMGGFDAPGVTSDRSKVTRMLMLLHPPGSKLTVDGPRSVDFRVHDHRRGYRAMRAADRP